MNAPVTITPNALRHYDPKDRYARCITVSKRVNWDIDDDVIRGRRFHTEDKFLPDGLSQVDRLDFMEEADRRFLSRIQGRTFANIFGLAERFVNAKVLEISHNHVYGDQQQVVRDAVLAAYRWQYVVSGVQGTRFVEVLGEMVSDKQMQRVTTALAPLIS